MYILASLNCQSYSFLRLIYFIKVALRIITIAVPIILIVVFSIRLFKAMSTNEDEMKRVAKSSVKIGISAILIFFVPTIVNFILSMIGQVNFEKVACWEEATIENVNNAKINQYMSMYTTDIKNYKSALEVVIDELGDNYTDEEKDKIDDLYKRIDENIEDKDIDELYDNSKEIQKIYDELNKKQKKIVWDDIKDKLDKLIASTGMSSDGLALVMQYEGNEGYCDSAHSTYRAANIGDGTVTAGYGVTNYDQSLAISLGYGQYFPMHVGDCVPVNVMDNILAADFNQKADKVKSELSKYNLTWKQNQIDAVVSLAYNCGDSYIPRLVKAYADGGNQGIWDNGFNKCIRATNGNPIFNQGLMNRRKSEYNLFLTGNYVRGF